MASGVVLMAKSNLPLFSSCLILGLDYRACLICSKDVG